MKMKQEHFNQLVKMLEEVAGEYGWKRSSGGIQAFGDAYHSYYQVSLERTRWNILHLVPNEPRIKWCNEVYEYLNDSHIDTALRKIFGHEKGE